jgi:conjugative relaxase-like TrwC/TraI family protein
MMHPRRLKGTPGNIARYYAIGDYYTKGGAEGSAWGGGLAQELGLAGEVGSDQLRALLQGKVAGQQLGRHRQDGIQHHPGWDFAISAPKSVSIMALAVGDDRIIQAHERAVDVALSYLEEHASLRRREDGKIVHETTGRLLWARFTEHASRELDPHLHTHVVILNMTNRETDGPMASLETRAMFAEQMASGQIYRNELAHGLRELGYGIEFDPRRGLFEIRGVPQALVHDMSQRAEQIEAHARENGLEGQAARRQSFYATRGPKVTVGLDTLHGQWRERLGDHARPVMKVREEADRIGEHQIATLPADAARATLFGIRQSEGREAVNPLGRLLTTGLASHVGEVRLRDVRPLIQDHEARRKLLATREETGDQILTRGRTSRRTLRYEQALSQHLALSLDDGKPVASAERLLLALEGAGLSPAQEQALVQMATARDRVTGLHGVAGAGKSTLIRTLNAAAHPGTTLIALAPTSSAAAGLGDSANIKSRTVASLLAAGGHGLIQNKTGNEVVLELSIEVDGEVLPLYPELEDELAELAKTAPRDEDGALTGTIILDPRTRQRWTWRYMSTIHRRICEAAGLPKAMTFTGFRHGGITELGDAGADDVRPISGHKTLNQTRIYNKANAEKGRKIALARRAHIKKLGIEEDAS